MTKCYSCFFFWVELTCFRLVQSVSLFSDDIKGQYLMQVIFLEELAFYNPIDKVVSYIKPKHEVTLWCFAVSLHLLQLKPLLFKL